LQDELTQRVVNEIAGSYGALTRAKLSEARRKPPASLDSYDCVLRAYEYLHVHVAEKHLAARDCMERVVEADPDYADGHAWLGYLYADQFHHRWNDRPEEYVALDRALAHAERAASLDTTNHVAHGALALTSFFRADFERAKVESDRTVELNPNNAIWLSLIGVYLSQQVDFERGMPLMERALALDPNPPRWIRMPYFYENYLAGRYEQALEDAKTIRLPGDFRSSMFLAATYGQLDRVEDARAAVEEFRELGTILCEKRGVDGLDLAAIRLELIERHAYAPTLADGLIEGLEKAGLH
jgi:tetratricopeptide (TPR) repeat protein